MRAQRGFAAILIATVLDGTPVKMSAVSTPGVLGDSMPTVEHATDPANGAEACVGIVENGADAGAAVNVTFDGVVQVVNGVDLDPTVVAHHRLMRNAAGKFIPWTVGNNVDLQWIPISGQVVLADEVITARIVNIAGAGA